MQPIGMPRRLPGESRHAGQSRNYWLAGQLRARKTIHAYVPYHTARFRQAAAGLVDNAVAAAAAWGDYDNDGNPDLFVANAGQDFLYRNNGDGAFNQVALFSGMTDTAMGSGANWFDFW